MKYLTLIIGLFAISIQSNAQDLLAQAKSGDVWGYINTKGEFVIDPQYTNCHAFSEGFAPIYDKKAKTFYFIKPDGSKLETEVEKFKLKNIFGFGTQGFQDGIVPIEVNKKWGYLKTDGKLLFEPKFEKAHPFELKMAPAKIGGKWVIVYTSGNQNDIEETGVEDVKGFQEELAPVKINGLWGFLDSSGKLAIKAQYKAVGYFSDGLAWVKDEAGMIGYIDKTGGDKIKALYNSAKDMTEGIARVKKGETWMLVTAEGKEISLETTDKPGKVSNGLAYAKKDGKVGFIGTDGKWVIDPQFDKVRDFKNGYAAVSNDDKWGYIDTKGNWVIKPEYNAVKDFEAIGK
jgi:hypothetical protein